MSFTHHHAAQNFLLPVPRHSGLHGLGCFRIHRLAAITLADQADTLTPGSRAIPSPGNLIYSSKHIAAEKRYV
ncbi:MAG TPA: hypothetical protein PKH04_12045 [Burkholderiaceae bacterium]|nr:hypothetical protein [Burkholderiaceae bacterium]